MYIVHAQNNTLATLVLNNIYYYCKNSLFNYLGDIFLKSRMDDAFMLKFLRARKFQVNKAFKLVSYNILNFIIHK